jgi:hypothetical protein
VEEHGGTHRRRKDRTTARLAPSRAARLARSPFREGAAIPPNTEGRVSVLKTRGAGAANAEAALRLISDSNAETTQTTAFEATRCEFQFGGHQCILPNAAYVKYVMCLVHA